MRATTRPFSLPLAEPLGTARGPIERREGLLVRLESEGSAAVPAGVGVGEATPLAGWTELREACEQALDAAASDVESGADPDDLLADLDDAPAARHALDLALADLCASAEGVPLYRYLGAPSRVESVPVNATVGDGSVEETVAAALDAVSAGFDCLKLKVGARDLSADIARVERVCDALDTRANEVEGDSEPEREIELRADANGAWSFGQAQTFLDAVGDDLSYVEQPLAATDMAGLAALDGPVALDETLAEVAFEDALDANPAAVVLKPMALGGPRRAVELAERAREAGVAPVVTTTVDAAVARTAAVHVAAAIPDPPACGLATAELLESDLVPDPAPVGDGRAAVPQGKGNGTPDTLSEYE
ncbi:o-succinylbenzoate synthase [Halorussus vallis]|uniref:mandelate racemase/muconate lactonizing enzyme family protein n=1 Tax=Halorussus vallis TaxID=2953749 RepID=UPI00209D81EA|nr:o-succinylbenzoate synthase [Halorussus vallis]USZ76061.1 o-succinylbenzoate synthase [Halorussus vallis]